MQPWSRKKSDIDELIEALLMTLMSALAPRTLFIGVCLGYMDACPGVPRSS